MWSRTVVFCLLSCLTIACKKQTFDYNKDAPLQLDTFSILLKSSIVERRDSAVKISLDMLTLSGTNDFKNYKDNSFKMYDDYSTQLIDSIEYKVIKSVAAPHASVIIFDSSAPYWYTNEKSGFYFKRFLNQEQYFPNSQIALFAINNSNEFDYYKDGNNFFVENRPESIEWINERTINGVTTSQNTDFLVLYNNLNDIIDSLNLHSPLGFSKHILLIQNYYWIDYAGGNISLINSLIAPLKSSNIKLNSISGESFNNDQWIMSQESQGFISQQGRSTFDPVYGDGYESPFSPEELCFANLDRLLSQNYVTHNASFWYYNQNDSLFPGDKINFNFQYGKSSYILQHIIP